MKKITNKYNTMQLLKLAHLELVTSYGEIDGKERKKNGLHINNIPLVDIIQLHLDVTKSNEV